MKHNSSQAKILSFELGQPKPTVPVQKKKSSKKYPEKAIQSLFRTSSQNTYQLYESVDRKANILISINAIILSILISSSFAQGIELALSSTHLVTLVGFCSISILLALMAVKPFVIKADKIGMKKNKMINLAAIQSLDIDAFKSKASSIIKSEDKIYESMVEDMFFIGKNVVSKHKFLQSSALVFVGGLLVSVLLLVF